MLIVGAFVLRGVVTDRFGGSDAEVLSYTAERATISSTVSGSGSLTGVGAESIVLPAGVEVTKVAVRVGETVSAGDVLATVNMTTVSAALADLQSQMEDLDQEISAAEGDSVSTSIKAGVAGRVKAVYAEKGETIAACIAEHGALAVISLDGYMAVEVNTEKVNAGDAVTVTLSNGNTLEGTVKSAVGGIAEVLISDNGPAIGEEVTVADSAGNVLGSGVLYVHNPLSVTGVAGTVSGINVQENAKVSATTVLFNLKDTAYSANYDTLLRERRVLEQELLELLHVYRDGAVTAAFDGVVRSVDFSADEQEDGAEVPVVTLYPNETMSVTISVDESDILTLKLGQEVDVTVSSVSEDSFTGVVTEINKEANTSSGVTTYSAVVELDYAEGMLTGMTAKAVVRIEGVENTVVVPVDAVHQTSAISYVYTSYDEKTGEYGGMTQVVTGLSNDNYIEIISGLEEGTEVYYTESKQSFFMPGNMGGFGGGNMPSGSMGGFGGGTLAEEGAMAIRLPAGVKLTEFYVDNYTYVTEGTPLAGVDRVSVMNAISDVQETLDYLKEQIEKAGKDTATVTVSAPVSGYVKAIFGESGDDAAAVMAKHGALAVLSLDGLMAVEFETTAALSAGDTVWVGMSDGREVAGTVKTALNGTVVVTVVDNGYAIGEEVEITNSSDKRLGIGELYVHYGWNVVSYSGTISQVSVKEGSEISKGTRMMTLKSVEDSSEYEMLSKQHREYETLMLELFVMYQNQAILAPCDGVVSGVERDSVHLLAATNGGYSVSLPANAPNGNDEIGYVNFVGQAEFAGVDSWSVRMNPTSFAVADYMDLTEVDLRTELMTESVNYPFTAPIYEMQDGAWVQIDSTAINKGDILLFAGDENGNCVWMVRIQRATPAPEVSPEIPPVTSPEVSPEVTPDGGQGQPGFSPNPGMGGGMQMQGGMPSMGGFGAVEEFELFDLDGTDILFVTPQDTMTLSISVDERDIGKLTVGQTAEVTVDVLKGTVYTAEITEIGMTGSSDGGSSKFTVVLTMERAENMLAGMHAAAVLTQGVTQDALLIPVAALVEYGNQTIVYTKQSGDELSNSVEVTTGASDGEFVEILSGLKEGDSYCYTYYEAPEVDNKAK